MTQHDEQAKRETATIGGGCFWCTEAVFLGVEGVLSVESGYAGGQKKDPTYEQVCDGTTGHAEVIKVEFDPAVIGYRNVLEIFFATHDPTQLNRQGNDVGTQYRSSIFTHSDEQRKVALEVIGEFGSLDAYLWSFVDGKTLVNRWRDKGEVPASTELSDRMSKALKKRGFRFVGTTICYSLLQATGMINDHLVGCFRYKACGGKK